MKEKIQLLSKGILEYENPLIEVSEESLSLEVEAGKTLSGSFAISSKNQVEIRAMIFSSCKTMRCLESSIIGQSARIHYSFDSEGLEIGEVIRGRFTLVCNGCVINLPYQVRVCAPFFETSMGPMNELDSFAMLARYNWSEALDLFSREAFKSVFLRNQKFRAAYESLIKSCNLSPEHTLSKKQEQIGRLSRTMEEFLCTIRRKEAVSFHVTQDMIEYLCPEKEISSKLLIEKDQWGYIEMHVYAEGDFIKLYRDRVTDEDFLGSYYQLEYTIKPDIYHDQRGLIVIETMNQRVEIPVVCHQEHVHKDREEERQTLRSSWLGLYRKYRDLSLGRISRQEWLFSARDDIDGCMNNSDHPVYKVVEAHYYLLAGDEAKALSVIERINGRELLYDSGVYYSYYLFINALIKRDEHYSQYVKDTLRFYAEGQYSDRWELGYFLVRLDKAEGPQTVRAFRRLKEIYEQHMPGTALYLEAIRLVNANPAVLREMGPFEISLFVWGVRHDCLTREAIYQYADLVSRMRFFHAGCLQGMMTLCEIYETKNLLTAVLRLLIQGDCKAPVYNKWYLLGIESSLNLPGLYEYYMASLDMENCHSLPTAVLIYFQYDNRLGVDKKAFLFRYILEHKDQTAASMDIYEDVIKAFTFDQLQKGRISGDLAFLYSHYLTKEALTPHIVNALPKVIFKQYLQISAGGDQVQGVIVDYAELNHELYYPVENGGAYIDLFMDDYRILFVDQQGCRYMSAVSYKLEALMDSGRYIRECLKLCRDDEMVLLNRSERALKYQLMDDSSIDVYKQTLKQKGISRRYQKTILKNLIDYYYDSYEGETLEKYLLRLDISLLGSKERSQIIEYYIQRGLFDRAFQAIQTYGYENIQDKRIMRLSSRMIREQNYEQNQLLVEMAHYAFTYGKYDEAVLQYLIRYYNGSSEELFDIWQAATNFEVPADELEERLICEMLFTEKLLDRGPEVFISYYKNKPKHMIVRAFLTYFAYQYLLGECKSAPGVFHIMEIELEQMEAGRTVCSLALLKFYQEDGHVEPEYYGWIRQEIAGFIDQGLVFPFFASFAGCGQVPVELVDLSFIEYRAKAGSQVSISYHLDSLEGTAAKQEMACESMPHMVGAIYIRAFRLFSGDVLHYSITEKGADGEKTTEFRDLVPKIQRQENPSNGVDLLNRMLDCVDFHDELTLDEEIYRFERYDQMAAALFTLRQE